MITAVGDCHGSPKPLEIAKEKIKLGTVVFLGDYFDSYDYTFAEQMETFKNIIEFKKANPTKVRVLIGNHDMAYLAGDFHVSGHQRLFHQKIMEVLRENLEYLDIVYYKNKWMFSHAGVSQEWIDEHFADVKNESMKNLSEHINKRFHEEYFSMFDFVGPNCYGDNPNEGLLWIRPNSLINHSINCNQVVGHTELPIAEDRIFSTSKGKTLLFIDSEKRGIYAMVDGRDFKVVKHGISESKESESEKDSLSDAQE